MSRVFRDVALSVTEERVGLVDEEDHSVSLCVSPVEDFVQLCDSLVAERCDVGTDHDCILKATLHGELLGEECLTGTWRPIEHHVLAWGVMLLPIENRIRNLS